ncbi:peroxisome biogenesis protein 2 isoform X1 [Selaginella moellendorffii]|uniref:peroxisome biogenesis protein 2 isoform X1 n=1 Tax=Selaginella moellendorffii TaxID=88036 RepID=UPI000D1CC4CB|nr:peroxisome biogenesis protein 2 isoform X1 [Selaginella moellendorffii]|eukprot:XP_024537184.1 peroxisome biogenesis protein 2 isoform X1 [Selaginella moellendorffii]
MAERAGAAAAAVMRPPSPEAWRQVWRDVLRSQQLRKTIPSVAISRVNQFDAERLDFEMTGMLRGQLLKIFSFVQPGLLSRYEPELNAFLEFLIWRFSIWVDRPTPGNALMNLRYRDEREFLKLPASQGMFLLSVFVRAQSFDAVRTGLEGPGLTALQKIFYCLALVGGRYGWARLQLVSAFQRWGDRDSRSWPRRVWVLLQRAESFYKVAYMINLIAFLRTGRYRNLVERLLQTRLVYLRPNMSRAVSFEYMNHQLVWQEFSELLLLVLPLLNVFSLKKVLPSSLTGKETVKRTDEETCPICEVSPINVPYMAVPCGHRHCYYCLSTRCIANSTYRCARCNSNVTAMQRYHPQVELGSSDQQNVKNKI